jgi:hypothetical protein
MGQITKTERRKALKRVTAFRAEFAAKPEHAIDLCSWYDLYNVADKVDKVLHCGTVGCVGGYAEYSPLMTTYLSEHGLEKPKDSPCSIDSAWIYSFFGVTRQQAVSRNLFTARLHYNMPDKIEALGRLDRLIRWHKTQLETV